MSKAKGRFIAPATLRNARALRCPMTPAEKALWHRIRDGRLGARFRRQHPIGRYIVDFYCAKARLVIEIDGDVHSETNRVSRDAARTAWLEARGYRVIRYVNSDILRNADGVLESILEGLGKRARPEGDG